MFFLTGRRLKRLVPSAAIRDWALAATGLADWMLDECYSVVGDGAETAALVARSGCRRTPTEDLPLAAWLDERILPLQRARPGRRSRRA